MFPKNFGNTQIIRFNSVIHFGGTVPLFLVQHPPRMPYIDTSWTTTSDLSLRINRHSTTPRPRPNFSSPSKIRSSFWVTLADQWDRRLESSMEKQVVEFLGTQQQSLRFFVICQWDVGENCIMLM